MRWCCCRSAQDEELRKGQERIRVRMDRKPVEVDEDVEDHDSTLVVGICILMEMKLDHDGFEALYRVKCTC